MQVRFKKQEIILVLLLSLSFLSASSQSNTTAFISGDFADPSIIKAKGKYYSIGTSSEWAPHYPIYSSNDLKQWKQIGYVFDKTPDWTVGSFWAPEYYYRNRTYYVYYTARRKSDNISCVGVATSKYPDRGFIDHGVIIDFGKEAIDAFVYDDNGQLYITFKAYGLDKRPIEILGSRLSDDGLKLEGEIFSLLKDDSKQGMEGQSMLKEGDYYYLFYSAGNCCGLKCSYNVRVARSKNIRGPYEIYSQNPILSATDAWKCTGHGTFVKLTDGNYKYIYHAFSKENNVFSGREGMIADLEWNKENGWPRFIIKESSGNPIRNISDNFKETAVAKYWQWDFRNASPAFSQSSGMLQLSGSFKETNQTGIALTVRQVSNHFDFSTTVTNHNAALKGLVFYGDANAAIGIGVKNDSVEYWIVKDNKRTTLAQSKLNAKGPIQLKFSMKKDLSCEVFFKQKNSDWQQLGADVKQQLSFLPQWDRSPRAGLHFKGNANEKAVFSGFELVNR